MFKHTLATATLLAATAAGAAPLTLEVFNPGEAAIFPVASVLVKGDKDAVLVDAQFSRAEAEKLAAQIKASGKRLTTIYISHGDPDFYFGLDVLKAAFPQARIVARPTTIAAIQAKADAKRAYWGPILGANAPQAIVMPEPLNGDIELEGRKLLVQGQGDRSYVWIPSIKAVVGGVVLFKGLHVWVADTQTLASRQQWLNVLGDMAKLQPETVVPGHFAPGASLTPDAIDYTADYLRRFESASQQAADSAALIGVMKAAYPRAGLESALDLSAKVAKGELKW